MQTLLTTNLSVQVHFRAFAEVARPAGRPAGRAAIFWAIWGRQVGKVGKGSKKVKNIKFSE